MKKKLSSPDDNNLQERLPMLLSVRRAAKELGYGLTQMNKFINAGMIGVHDHCGALGDHKRTGKRMILTKDVIEFAASRTLKAVSSGGQNA